MSYGFWPGRSIIRVNLVVTCCSALPRYMGRNSYHELLDYSAALIPRTNGLVPAQAPSRVFSAVRLCAGERLRTHLRRRHTLGGRAQAYQRFPDTPSCQHLRLFPLPTVVGWKSAHASAGSTSESPVRESRMHGLMREGRRSCLGSGYRGTAKRKGR